jgi:hypothetical protein
MRGCATECHGLPRRGRLTRGVTSAIRGGQRRGVDHPAVRRTVRTVVERRPGRRRTDPGPDQDLSW